MRKITRMLALLLCAMLLTSCGAGLSEGDQIVELFAVNVGKGDALIVRVDDAVCLIDTGKPYARGKVRSALSAMNVTALDAVFLTHMDSDHVGGLEWLADDDLLVGAWYAPAYCTGVKEGKHPVVRTAGRRGQEVQWLRRGDTVSLGSGALLRVLAPDRQFDDKDDNNSLVMMLETAQGRMLLTGDMELPEEAVLLSQGDDLSCDVLKAPNHGDDDTLSQAFARAAAAKVAVISTDSVEKPGTPDPGVVSRLMAAGSVVVVTQDAGLGLRLTLKGGEPAVAAVNIDAPRPSGIVVQSVVPGDDLVTLRNDGADCDLTGWYLYSDRGGELYAFPDEYVLRAGQTVTIGTNTSDEDDYDLLWDDKKVIHKSKRDDIELFDGWGRIIDAMSNGY